VIQQSLHHFRPHVRMFGKQLDPVLDLERAAPARNHALRDLLLAGAAKAKFHNDGARAAQRFHGAGAKMLEAALKGCAASARKCIPAFVADAAKRNGLRAQPLRVVSLGRWSDGRESVTLRFAVQKKGAGEGLRAVTQCCSVLPNAKHQTTP
jgi:hypothetical protein